MTSKISTQNLYISITNNQSDFIQSTSKSEIYSTQNQNISKTYNLEFTQSTNNLEIYSTQNTQIILSLSVIFPLFDNLTEFIFIFLENKLFLSDLKSTDSIP